MLSVGIVFIFVAAISFLGFAINALFEKLKITSVLPLLLIGLVVGPVLGLVSTGPQSTISQLAPIIVAVAVSFVLFDVGLNIKLKSLGRVFTSATIFTMATQTVTGVLVSLLAYFGFHWGIIYALIFGFAASGPSSIIVPQFVSNITASEDIKSTLVYESVISDVIQLIIPLILITFLLNPQLTSLRYISLYVFTNIFGAVLLGIVSAFFWLYILKRFKTYSENYSWVLTIAMILATYGIAQQLGLESAVAVFIFGLLFANIGSINPHRSEIEKKKPNIFEKYFSIGDDVKHTASYQREIVFFVSTFFFVYIGLLFSTKGINLLEMIAAFAAVLVIVAIRYIMAPLLRKMFSKEPKTKYVENSLVHYNIPRGLSSAIIATIPVTYGLIITGFTNTMFLIILFTNIAFSIGIFFTYDATKAIPKDNKDQAKDKGTQQQKDKK